MQTSPIDSLSGGSSDTALTGAKGRASEREREKAIESRAFMVETVAARARERERAGRDVKVSELREWESFREVSSLLLLLGLI